MQPQVKENVSWISDLVLKVMCGACTILLSIAVNSLSSMNNEIKSLSANVFELSTQSKVIAITTSLLEKRLDKLEVENEKLKEKLASKN
jgi:chemotaxis protein CheY-P-specific phosphatase CheC